MSSLNGMSFIKRHILLETEYPFLYDFICAVSLVRLALCFRTALERKQAWHSPKGFSMGPAIGLCSRRCGLCLVGHGRMGDGRDGHGVLGLEPSLCLHVMIFGLEASVIERWSWRVS